MKKRRLKRYLCGALVILAASACLWTGFRTRGSIKVKAEAEVPGPQVIFYRQDDPLWAGDFLGSSPFTMESSGCLTTCISSLIQLQKVGGPAAGESHPGTLNRYFSERQVYDGQGNIQWEPLEQALGVSVIRKDAGDMEPGELEELLKEGVYPIVRVRVGGVGSFHYVLVVESAGGEYWCMDPMNQKEELAPLSDFRDRIYGVRYLLEKTP